VFVSLGQQANIQGRIIGTNLVGGQTTFNGMVGTLVNRIFDYTVGATGLTEAATAKEGLDIETVLVPGLDHTHYFPGAQLVGLKMVAERSSGRILGVQVVGPGDGAKRLDVAAAAITMGATVEDLTQFNLGYSPPYTKDKGLRNRVFEFPDVAPTGLIQPAAFTRGTAPGTSSGPTPYWSDPGRD
jgi:NADPH-dependent 2,4-dienoyl-CoA reductase/sulfur reductase-like enzyme